MFCSPDDLPVTVVEDCAGSIDAGDVYELASELKVLLIADRSQPEGQRVEMAPSVKMKSPHRGSPQSCSDQ